MWSLFFTNFLILWSWFSETLTFFGYSFSVTVSKSNIYKILLDMQHVMLHILVENTLWIAQKWSLVLTSWRFTSTGPYFFESVQPGPYKGGPYKMIMRVMAFIKTYGTIHTYLTQRFSSWSLNNTRYLAALSRIPRSSWLICNFTQVTTSKFQILLNLFLGSWKFYFFVMIFLTTELTKPPFFSVYWDEAETP